MSLISSPTDVAPERMIHLWSITNPAAVGCGNDLNFDCVLMISAMIVPARSETGRAGFGARGVPAFLGGGAGGGFGAGGRRTMDTVLAGVHSKVRSVDLSSSVSALSIW